MVCFNIGSEQLPIRLCTGRPVMVQFPGATEDERRVTCPECEAKLAAGRLEGLGRGILIPDPGV